MSFSNWRISRKLTSAFAALSVAFLLVSGTLAAHVVAAHSALEADEYSYRVLELSSAMMTALANQQDALRGYVAKPDEEFLRTYAQHGEEYAGAANTFQATANSEAERSEAAQITALAAQFHHEADQTFALARNPATLDQARTGIAATARLLQVRDVVNTVTERQRVTRGLR
ncbi:MAG: CHASE3 domain-containing protein, partial [Caulobacteraceae bacterium]